MRQPRAERPVFTTCIEEPRVTPWAMARRCLTSSNECPRTARQFVTQHMRAWGADPATRDWAALVVSELVTNACIHASSTHIRVLAARLGNVVYVAVLETAVTGSSTPQPTPALDGREGGRGLRLVAGLSRGWGLWHVPTGTLSWASHPLGGVPRSLRGRFADRRRRRTSVTEVRCQQRNIPGA